MTKWCGQKENIVRRSRLCKRQKRRLKRPKPCSKRGKMMLLAWKKKTPEERRTGFPQGEPISPGCPVEVLEQLEQSLQGYAEGARFLLDAARKSKLEGTRGALSAALDVPAELETAIAAALGEYLDAVLLENGQLDQALSLLESDQAGRAVLLPLGGLAKPAALKLPPMSIAWAWHRIW
jgi:hypothetical protein